MSIIIPTFNRAALLSECLKSILSQTYADFEVIIVDDGSTDDTEKVVAELDNRISYCKLQKTANLSVLRNYGIEHSKGEFIAFCDDDDLWIPEKLSRQMKFMKQFNIVCTNAEIIDSAGMSLSGIYFKEFEDDVQLNTVHLLIRNFVMTSTVCLRKKILPELPFDYIKYKSTAEDYDLWLKLSFENSIYFINEPLIKYRLHSNLTHRIDNQPQIYINSINIIKSCRRQLGRKNKKYADWGIFKLRKDYLKLHISKNEFPGALKETIKLLYQFLKPALLLLFIKKVLNPRKNIWESA